jgi:hypothetical protein
MVLGSVSLVYSQRLEAPLSGVAQVRLWLYNPSRTREGDMAGIWRVILLALLVCGSATAQAGRGVDFFTGNQLHEMCQARSDQECAGYILGVAGSTSESSFCLPNGADGKQVVDTAKLWLANHPEQRHKVASYLVRQALAENFPCR